MPTGVQAGKSSGPGLTGPWNCGESELRYEAVCVKCALGPRVSRREEMGYRLLEILIAFQSRSGKASAGTSNPHSFQRGS